MLIDRPNNFRTVGSLSLANRQILKQKQILLQAPLLTSLQVDISAILAVNNALFDSLAQRELLATSQVNSTADCIRPILFKSVRRQQTLIRLVALGQAQLSRVCRQDTRPNHALVYGIADRERLTRYRVNIQALLPVQYTLGDRLFNRYFIVLLRVVDAQ